MLPKEIQKEYLSSKSLNSIKSKVQQRKNKMDFITGDESPPNNGNTPNIRKRSTALRYLEDLKSFEDLKLPPSKKKIKQEKQESKEISLDETVSPSPIVSGLVIEPFRIENRHNIWLLWRVPDRSSITFLLSKSQLDKEVDAKIVLSFNIPTEEEIKNLCDFGDFTPEFVETQVQWNIILPTKNIQAITRVQPSSDLQGLKIEKNANVNFIVKL